VTMGNFIWIYMYVSMVATTGLEPVTTTMSR